MANAVYPSWRNALLTSTTVSLASDHRMLLIDTGTYTYNTAHDFLDDVTAGARIATSGAMTNPTTGTVSTGTYDADDITYSSVTGASIEALIHCQWTGTESTSELTFFEDTSITNFPLTPNGGNITLSFNASGILTLG